MTPEVSFVALADAAPAEMVVVIDVLRAFTLVPWLYERGVHRVVAVATREEALELRAAVLPDALLAGEHGGRPYPDFDLGNSPSEVRDLDLAGRTVVHRTSAGTQGLARTVGSGTVFAASFVAAAATARHLRELAPGSVTFVITGASLGRDGDEDRSCAELVHARLEDPDTDPGPYLARVASSDAGRAFGPAGPAWAPPADLQLACEVDRFPVALHATPAPDVEAIEITPRWRR